MSGNLKILEEQIIFYVRETKQFFYSFDLFNLNDQQVYSLLLSSSLNYYTDINENWIKWVDI